MSTTDLRPVTAERSATNWPQLLANGTLLGLWLWLYWPLAGYLQIVFTDDQFRTNQILLGGILLLIGARLHAHRRGGALPPPDAAPQAHRLPLLLALGGSLAYLLVERFLDVHTVAASLFGLASYGLFGLWLAPVRWRRGLPAALLLILTLPFGAHMETFIGYPLRIATAVLVRDGLAAIGVGSVGVDTILVFENGVSQVDVPCSGVQSLWTGAMFLIAATWIEGRRLSGRWLATAVLFTLALLAANLTRVAVLVTLGEVLGWRLLAEMLHVPLGVLGFGAACAFALWLLRRAPHRAAETPIHPPSSTRRRTPFRIAALSLALIPAVALMALLYTPRPQSGLSQPAPTWNFGGDVTVEPLPLKPDELAWLTRDGAESASRFRFTSGAVGGSMILIPSRTWRAHHRPERCFEVYGLTLNDSQTHLVSPTLPIRQVSLGQGNVGSGHTAAYWFQSASRTTDDYGTRMWADLAAERERWVLVSILFDDAVPLDDADAQSLFSALHAAVDAHLGERRTAPG